MGKRQNFGKYLYFGIIGDKKVRGEFGEGFRIEVKKGGSFQNIEVDWLIKE